MKITEIYDNYHINKGLREHMLRVAAVAKSICDVAEGKFDTKNIVSACLVHDMGNIVKAEFGTWPEFFEPEGVEYYKRIQEEFREKYGEDDHHANLEIVKEIGITSKMLTLVDAFGIESVDQVHESGLIDEMVSIYSDLRVGPYRIVKLDDRFDDLVERYVPHKRTIEEMENGRTKLHLFEDEIFSQIHMTPTDITDESILSIQEELKDWDIETRN